MIGDPSFSTYTHTTSHATHGTNDTHSIYQYYITKYYLVGRRQLF